MPRPTNSPIRFQLGIRGWAAIAVLAAIVAGVIALAIGLFVFFLPILLIAPIVYWFAPKPTLKPTMYPPNGKLTKDAANEQIIDGEFKVIDVKAIERKSEGSDEHSD